MSVWDSLVGQKPVIDMLSRIAQGDPSQITQSWLICGPPGSGRSNMARAFAAALESPDHGMSAEPTRVTQQVLAGTHPDVTVLTTNKVTIGIDQVREIITTSEQMPATVYLAFTNAETMADNAALLEKSNLRGTFFLTAAELTADPALARKLYAAGHILGVTVAEDCENVSASLLEANDGKQVGILQYIV